MIFCREETFAQEFDEDGLNVLRRSMRPHPPKRKPGREWRCRECNQKFESMQLVLKHRKEVHHEVADDTYYTHLDGVYRCKLCGVAAPSQLEIENHLLTHSDCLGCAICGQSFPSSDQYLYHLKTHASEDHPTSCPFCGAKSKSIRNLLRHINLAHLKNFPYYCMRCDKGFYNGIIFREHEDFHRSGKLFTCVVCSATFSHSPYLLAHQIHAHAVWIGGGNVKNRCPVCKRMFAKDGTLRNHLRMKHEGLKRHLCDYCGQSFPNRAKLRLHCRIHTGEKPFKCGYCEKSFSRKDYLVLHVRTHTGEKPHTCEHCGKSFSQQTTLRFHVRSHTGEKPYVCRICSAAFAVRASLTTHHKSCARK